jgi:uncharacterized membrane protein YccF (DUF307 family)
MASILVVVHSRRCALLNMHWDSLWLASHQDITLFPFGKRLVSTTDGIEDDGALCCARSCNCLLNVLWAVSVGWILALQAFLTGCVFILTVVGIPFGWQEVDIYTIVQVVGNTIQYNVIQWPALRAYAPRLFREQYNLSS